jgi:polyamine oxidase
VTDISIHDHHITIATPSTSLGANAVILAVPLGCLQHSTITFNPPLPGRIQSAITNLGFGNLEKIFLKFDTAWWITASPLEPPDVYTFLPPTTLPSSAPKQLLTMFSLARLPLHGQPVLAVYLADAWTTYIASESAVAIVDLFQKHYLPCLPNYTSDCLISDVMCTSWATDPWTYGSYTHVPVGSVDGVDDLWVLGERIVGLEGGVGGLWFAGEHAGTGDMGTVNGAMTSGRDAAVNVLREFGVG